MIRPGQEKGGTGRHIRGAHFVPSPPIKRGNKKEKKKKLNFSSRLSVTPFWPRWRGAPSVQVPQGKRPIGAQG